MALTVNMPQLGESVTEGTIARWLKQPGEQVAKYESIAEVITDKVNAEIPAPADGTMGELIAAEGAVIAVGQPICSIDTGDGAADGARTDAAPVEQAAPEPAGASPAASIAQQGDAAAEPAAAGATASPAAAAESAGTTPSASAGAPATAPPQSMAPPQVPPASTSGQPPAEPAGAAAAASGSGNGAGVDTSGYHLTPAVRMLVREHGVDLSQLQGSGIGGRITKKDVLEYVQRRDAAPAAAAAPSGEPAPVASGAPPSAPHSPMAPAGAPPAAPGPPAATPQPVAASTGGGDTVQPMTSVRRAIADHMVRSKQTSPHAYCMFEVDMTRVAAARNRNKQDFEQRYGVKLTYLPFVARAVCEALRRHPTLNATWSDEGVVLKRDIHLGIAVALEDNLVVPVVRNADRLNIVGLATTMADLGDRARSNHLKLDEIQGGTFTLNNTGALGAVMTEAIINQPQAAIMTMDLVVKRPVVVENDAIAIRPMMNLGMSFDHRINDGLQATRFVKEVKTLLEGLDPASALL